MIKKILVPMDGSECSVKAAEMASSIAKLDSSIEVIIFTVHRMPMKYVEKDLYWLSSSADDHVRHIEEVFNDTIEEIKNKVDSFINGINYKFDYSLGTPADEICKYAENNNIDLIIMGSRGLGAVKGIIMGSVSHKVLQIAHCPVTLVREANEYS